jgi:carbamate kinase
MAREVRPGAVALVAFGGNAILRSGEAGTMAEQEANARSMCEKLLTVIERGYDLVVTYGNGPQVGHLMIQNELAKDVSPELPLDVLVAETEGSIGYLLQQQLLNGLRARRIPKLVVTMITQVIVDRNDPAFANPTKPVGPFYTEEDAKRVAAHFPHWKLAPDAQRGYRRIVPSPMPKQIIQSRMIRSLVYGGNVVLALGGGGIPIAKDPDGRYVGVEAVIDKDLSSAMLANDVKADLYIILTGVEKVCLNFGTADERPLDRITRAEAERYAGEGHFPPGSMGPKIASAIKYLEGGGAEAIITDAENLGRALDGRAGTRIVMTR